MWTNAINKLLCLEKNLKAVAEGTISEEMEIMSIPQRNKSLMHKKQEEI